MRDIEKSTERNEILNEHSVLAVKTCLEGFYNESKQVDAKLACFSADRFYRRLNQDPCQVTLAELARGLEDIESRFHDHLHFVKLYVIPEERSVLLEGADTLLNHEVAERFPSIWFDCEEAAKCLCFGRYTASIFHAMRMLEIGIASLAKRLNIENPAKSTDRSWGIMLSKIKGAIDSQFPKQYRSADSEGAHLESIYASLDAIKNPWRNATMHVESIYTEEEARHIISCTSILFGRMAQMFDEDGLIAPAATLPLPEPDTIS